MVMAAEEDVGEEEGALLPVEPGEEVGTQVEVEGEGEGEVGTLVRVAEVEVEQAGPLSMLDCQLSDKIILV